MKTNRLLFLLLLAGMVGGVSAFWVAERMFDRAQTDTVVERVVYPPAQLEIGRAHV